nr:chymotrypsin inhibitor-like [Aegilops tauschii subsp. strangulata]
MHCFASPSSSLSFHATYIDSPSPSNCWSLNTFVLQIDLGIAGLKEATKKKRKQKMSTIKTSWPEVVGWPAAQAVTQVNTDRPDVAIEVLPSGTSVSPGFSSTRVHVFFDGTGSVAATPQVG